VFFLTSLSTLSLGSKTRGFRSESNEYKNIISLKALMVLKRDFKETKKGS
jgi:hypothetical protein